MENPGFYAILPADVRYDKRLKPAEKIFYAEITALANQAGYCYAGNSYFSQLYGVDERTVRRWVQHLQQYGYVDVTYAKEGTDNQRRISPLTGRAPEAFDGTEEADTDVQSGHTVSGADINVRTPRTSVSATPGHKCPPEYYKNNNTRENNTRACTVAEVFDSFAGKDTTLVNALNDFNVQRTKSKKPMTPRAAEILCKKLNKLTDEAGVYNRSGYMVALLEQSIERGWDSVWEYKDNFRDTTAHTTTNTEDCPREIGPDSNILDFL